MRTSGCCSTSTCRSSPSSRRGRPRCAGCRSTSTPSRRISRSGALPRICASRPIAPARSGRCWKSCGARRMQASARGSRSAWRGGKVGARTPDYVWAVLNAKLSQDDVIINEAIRNSGAVLQQIERTQPQTYVGLAGGGLGFAGGAGLGVKLARPQARVIQIVGDGAFHFSTPDSVYSVAQMYRLPVFTVILDNRGWQAVKESVLRVYPDGIAAKTDRFQSRLESTRQGDQRRLEDVARAFGAYGECCRDPADLSAAIDRCLQAVDDGQAAVLNVRVTPL